MAEDQDKVAVVTGAGSGIGQATAVAFAREGIRVVVSDISVPGGQLTAKRIREAGGEAMFVQTDVSDSSQVEALMEQTVRRFGRLDFACNNAGIGGPMAPTGDYPLDGWNQVIQVNLTGVFLCMRQEIPRMLANGGGAIVNMASVLGKVGFRNSPAYVAAKHAILGLTKTTALEYASQGIRVTAVCPAFIATPMLSVLDADPALRDAIVALHPGARLGKPEEVAEAVVWLCSDKASFVTGGSILVDGGYLAQ